jgi:hypothetical protein
MEMLIGMAITAIVLLALTAAAVSVADAWVASDGTEQLQIQCAQIFNRLEYYLSPCKYIVQVQPGSLDGSAATPGSVLYWAYDGWNGLADGGIEAGEMALIQHDPTTQTLWLYEPIPVSQMSPAQLTAAGTPLSYSTVSNSSWVATFKALNYVTATPLGHNVAGATFAADNVSSTTQRPVVEITLALNRSPQPAITQYNAVMLRAPDTQPSP